MKLWIIGAVGGFILGLVLGCPIVALGSAVAGAGLGLIADQLVGSNEVEAPQPRSEAGSGDPLLREDFDLEARTVFLSRLVGLFTAVARCDGTIRREEIKVIRRFFEQNFSLTDEDGALVSRLLREALTSPVDMELALDGYAASSRAADRLLFLQALYEVALGDGDLAQSEQKLINRICADLGISEKDHRTIRGLFFDEPSSDDDYAMLGLEPGADEAELKKAFREMAATHHPDKVAHLGSDASAMAGRRFAEIKLAYERILQARAVS